MRQDPRVSILLATRNRARLLPAAIESVMRQTLNEWELLIANDGSTDETPGVLNTFTDPRISVLHSSVPRGIGNARNRGLRASHAPYVAYLDDDDWYLPAHIETLAHFLDTYREIGAVYSGCYFVPAQTVATGAAALSTDLTGAEINTDADALWHPDLLAFRGTALPSRIMHRRDLLDQVGMWSEGDQQVEDHELWLRMAAIGVRFAYVPARSVVRRRHAGSFGQRYRPLFAIDLAGVPTREAGMAIVEAAHTPGARVYEHITAMFQAEFAAWVYTLWEAGELPSISVEDLERLLSDERAYPLWRVTHCLGISSATGNQPRLTLYLFCCHRAHGERLRQLLIQRFPKTLQLLRELPFDTLRTHQPLRTASLSGVASRSDTQQSC